MSEHAPDPEPHDELDPGASTQLFQAFVDRYEPGGSEGPRTRVALIAAAVVGLLVVVVLALLLIAH